MEPPGRQQEYGGPFCRQKASGAPFGPGYGGRFGSGYPEPVGRQQEYLGRFFPGCAKEYRESVSPGWAQEEACFGVWSLGFGVLGFGFRV